MKEYNFKEIEKKWQDIWVKEKRYETPNHVQGKENAYVLIEFPYPSGSGLHVGHVRSYAALDAVARKYRMQGKNVLFPMGTDAFGLEAERTAIREKKLPQEIVARNIATFHEQLKTVGLSFDWSRTINTCEPEYYKWTQWQFIQFFKMGMANKMSTNVNFCPNCGVLANEEVEDGKCCQCGAETVQKTKAQWVLKMTKYGDRLDKDLALTQFLPHIKTSQKNWIGRSEGEEVTFQVVGGGSFNIFTTCIETIYGITFMVLAPEHQLVQEWKDKITNWKEVDAYIKETKRKSEFERAELSKGKTGVCLQGMYAINPVNGKQVPIYIADFVLGTYGNGAVMAVPTHDQRDFEFAQQHNIPMIEVIAGGNTAEKAFEKTDYLGAHCHLVNSEEFTGMEVEEAKQKIAEKLEHMGVAKKQVNFKMRDWIFSRQRYWGEPIPMVYCEKCGWVPVNEEDLPVVLPNVSSYEPTKDGESPLSTIPEFVNTTCPKCGGKAKRETDTMPGWAGSSWYFMRYCDPHNNQEMASKDALKAWMPVGLYNGGNEHTNRHLLYARFWNKMLYDLGISPVEEPFLKRISHGIILGSNGVKMSKSLGNVVDPRAVIKQYGADALRLWEAFIGDYSATVNWNDDGVKACHKLLTRIWALQEKVTRGNKFSAPLSYIFHASIQKITNDIDNIKFNTAVSQIMILVNEIYKVGTLNDKEFQTLLLLISPFAPHIAEELWHIMGYTPTFKDATWPMFDARVLEQSLVEIPVQVKGKIKCKLHVSKTATEAEVKEMLAKQSPELLENMKKFIYVPGRIVNIIN